MKQILVRHGEISAIAGLLRVSDRTVMRALRYERNSDIAKRIRKVALDRGGKETEYAK